MKSDQSEKAKEEERGRERDERMPDKPWWVLSRPTGLWQGVAAHPFYPFFPFCGRTRGEEGTKYMYKVPASKEGGGSPRPMN